MAAEDKLLSSRRITELGATRGLIMILMAQDHSMVLISKIHTSEMWARLLSDDYGGSLLLFFTRWISHLCAPGFALLMGADMILFAESRKKPGWETGSVIRHFLIKGFILIIASLTLEDILWNWGFLLRLGCCFS
ncbi:MULTISPECIES: hypothetical protein [Aminobacterium]|jgi:uncharacterized membrane protein|uniref:hypothetical protein n=1 Tax=Aminobacterium TaxID=81466 RepID=UPI00257F6844|nr:hypothetical protein [Aminobacterium sp. UBA4987]